MPRANIRPALGPPTFSRAMSTSNGYSALSVVRIPTIARPSSALPVVTTASCSTPSRLKPTRTFLPGSRAVMSSRSSVPPDTALPSIELITSPFARTPSDGESPGTWSTSMCVRTGMPSSRSAAVVAFSWDSRISALLCRSACFRVCPSG